MLSTHLAALWTRLSALSREYWVSEELPEVVRIDAAQQKSSPRPLLRLSPGKPSAATAISEINASVLPQYTLAHEQVDHMSRIPLTFLFSIRESNKIIYNYCTSWDCRNTERIIISDDGLGWQGNSSSWCKPLCTRYRETDFGGRRWGPTCPTFHFPTSKKNG